MRVVFDTNILVSAMAIPGGKADEALARIIMGRDLLILSRDILDELLSVLAKKFSRNADELARVAVFLSDLGRIVRPSARFKVLGDEADNRILECAVAGGAEKIVTGDRAMLDLGEYERISIVSLRTYLEG